MDEIRMKINFCQTVLYRLINYLLGSTISYSWTDLFYKCSTPKAIMVTFNQLYYKVHFHRKHLCN